MSIPSVTPSGAETLGPNNSNPSGSQQRLARVLGTLGEGIRAQAESHPERPAIVGSHFAPLLYRELQVEIDAVRFCLREAGFDRDARIAVAIASSAHAALTVVAISSCAIAFPIDPKLTVSEVERSLGIFRPMAVVLLRGNSSAARTVAEQKGLPIIEAKVAQAGRLGLKLAPPKIGLASPLCDPDPEAPAFVVQTSGTTAVPNLAPFSHKSMLTASERVRTWYELTPHDRSLTVSPVYYAHALITTVFPPLLTGGSLGFPANPTNVDISEWFDDLKPTWYSAGPTVHLAVAEKVELRPEAGRRHSLRFISSSGAQLSENILERLHSAFGVPVLEHYGSSETAQISANGVGAGQAKAGTCGIPWPDIVRVVGEEDADIPLGERGEIIVSGPTVMSGYLDAAELNRAAFVDGWFRTGDIGSLDRDGFLTLHGRKKELINRGGEKISPIEIDQALMCHPDVIQAAAFGVPHPRLGEDVSAAVVLQAGAKIESKDLCAFLGDRLAPFKIPRRIFILDDLPKGSSGKVQRKRLSEIATRESNPSNPLEIRLRADLLQIWKRVLKTDAVSLDDDFFEKGGDSLLAMDVSIELAQLIGRPLPEGILLGASSVRELAARLAHTSGDNL